MPNLPNGWLLSAFTDEAGGALGEQIAAAHRASLRFLDLRGVDGFNICALPLDHARQVKGGLDEAGLAIGMFGSPLGKVDIVDDFEAEMAKLRHLGDLAPLLDCRRVRIFSYYNAHGAAPSEWAAIALERLGQLKELARSLGLILFHENELHIFGEQVANVERIAALRDDSFRLIFDFDNFQQSGQDVWAAWETLRDQSDAFHLKDSTRENQHVPVGLGAGQVEPILRDAKARGWQGLLTIEPHLSHSGAVASTGPSGREHQAFSSLPPSESFHIAATAAVELLERVERDASG